MATEAPSSTSSTGKANNPYQQKNQHRQDEKSHRSIFELPADFFDSCRFLQSPSSSIIVPADDAAHDGFSRNQEDECLESNISENTNAIGGRGSMERWSCNTCKAEFESLQDQRSHFKSDIHRLNIKLSIAGKGTVKEEDFNETTSDSLCKDYDVSSISGSSEEDEPETGRNMGLHGRLGGVLKHKLFLQLQNGERVSFWKCLLLNESENIVFEIDKSIAADFGECFLTEKEVTEKLKYVIHEPRDATRLRVMLLARGGHFAGCVFDGNSIVAHKTFHRYVVRAKSGKRQSSKDASGKTVHSAGASLRRYNELALKKEIQELLAAWKPYFSVSSCVFLYAPSSNYQLFFDGERPNFNCQHHVIRNIPLTVRRPTLKEARRIYNLLTQVSSENDEQIKSSTPTNTRKEAYLPDSLASDGQVESMKMDTGENLDNQEITDICGVINKLENVHASSSPESESEIVCASTPLHEAAKTGNSQEVLELLEQGLDPCIKDELGRTPYMLATEKEVRNTFRRFMALNLDKWDWYVAKVPSALTKEMEESQAIKQAEKDAKRKARAKELKKLRKAREKKAQAEAAQSQNASPMLQNHGSVPISSFKGQFESSSLSKEERLKRAQDAEREKRAAAAERRIAAAAALRPQGTGSVASSSQIKVTETSDTLCSCCHVSLAGIVPFHRYNYKYCSASCMHVHKEILDDG
ncbi:uncharacterized protein [Coffea arabica]|uniref:VLRF1 domain-containing protein n=1 Tax=Coffea arabica TaxID=13443 RepID=A0ABM4WZH1_COFAR|nr:ankyrin repeat and zinc finger domain-containing protein 1 isoform X1 [Coffea arabica]